MHDHDLQVKPTRPSLILGAVAGDTAAWERFSRAYGPLLKGYAARSARTLGLSWGEADLDDVVQDIFMKLLRAMPNFAYDPSRRFRSYLSQCTRNAIADKLRRGTPLLDAEACEAIAGRGDEDDPEPVIRYFQATLGAVLPEIRSRCLARGNEAQWRSFLEAGMRGRPGAEVAEELGISKELVWTNTARVVKEVHRTCLQQYEADFGGDGLHELLGRQDPGVLSGLVAEVLQEASWLDPASPRPLDYFRDLLRAQWPGLRARTLARAPESWASFERHLRGREEADEPAVGAAATLMEEVDRLCRRRCEEDLGDAKLYHELRRMGPDIIADLCVGLLREGHGDADAILPG